MKIYYVKRTLARSRYAAATPTRRVATNARATFFGAVINQLRDVALSERNGDKVALLQKKEEDLFLPLFLFPFPSLFRTS